MQVRFAHALYIPILPGIALVKVAEFLVWGIISPPRINRIRPKTWEGYLLLEQNIALQRTIREMEYRHRIEKEELERKLRKAQRQRKS